ncbi:hypothetical protein EBH_0084200 [Eimeria brunetti]|uniref:Secreted protein n=1 Tax=Eimeria brunetti TaxID=51314 RepID=U6LH99_9EIME|nr:hypothetical protein EBH_0084200 [Eimeria brunetti]
MLYRSSFYGSCTLIVCIGALAFSEAHNFENTSSGPGQPNREPEFSQQGSASAGFAEDDYEGSNWGYGGGHEAPPHESPELSVPPMVAGTPLENGGDDDEEEDEEGATYNDSSSPKQHLSRDAGARPPINVQQGQATDRSAERFGSNGANCPPGGYSKQARLKGAFAAENTLTKTFPHLKLYNAPTAHLLLK